MATNPFQSIYDSIISALSITAVTNIVDSDNIVRLDSRIAPLIDDRNVGDLPMLKLTPVPGGERNLHHSSGTARFQLIFELQYSTAEEKLDATAGLFALDWATMQAFHNALPDFDNEYVTKFELGEWSPLSPFEVEESQETGWQSTLEIVVDGCVQRDDLLVN